MDIDYDSLFCFVDDFYKGFEPWYKKSLLTCGTKKRNRECNVNCNELLTPYCNELLTPLGSIKTVKIQLSFKFKYILILIKI